MPSCTYNSIARIGGTLILRGAAEIGVDDYSPNNRSVGKDNRALSSSVRERTARGVLRDDSSEGSHGEKMWRAPPPSFCYCPLTMVVMKDPVQDREGENKMNWGNLICSVKRLLRLHSSHDSSFIFQQRCFSSLQETPTRR